MALGLALAGCSTFGKKPQAKPNASAQAPAGPEWPTQHDSVETTAAERATQTGYGGLLAGRVLDSFDHKPPPTYIQVIPAQEARDPKSSPIEATTDDQGYFVIRGLQPGQHYQLIARTRQGDLKLAGTTWATPPNPRLLIYVSEDFATPSTPAAPAPPVLPRQNPSGNPKSSNPPKAGGVDLGTPIRIEDSAGRPTAPPASVGPSGPRTEVRPEDLARNGQARAAPPVSINPQGRFNRQPESQQPDPRQDGARLPEVATRVPSCQLTGKQLVNFALNDLNGRPWEYRNHRGKVVLLDFWGTWCRPCLATIPHLKILEDQYSSAGLEVIGIAHETGSFPQQVQQVKRVRDRLKIDYQLLLAADLESCPVKTQFGVTKFPTLVLLDANNRIIWQQEGMLDRNQRDYLEMLIKQHLGVR
jgi:thiol-disulfide isomerase/thioredoxin